MMYEIQIEIGNRNDYWNTCKQMNISLLADTDRQAWTKARSTAQQIMVRDHGISGPYKSTIILSKPVKA